MQNWLKTVLLVVGSVVILMISGTSRAESATQTLATAAHAHGVHGMVLFGEPGRVFASHLPLYRHPHDWQVVLELFPATETAQKFVNDLLQTGGLLTLEPERFDLLRLQPGAAEPLREFKATLYQGHFERGGSKVAELDWQVKSTPLFLPVRIDSQATGHAYHAIGQNRAGSAMWLLHRVERRPDLDQILRIRPHQPLPASFRTDQLLTTDSEDPRFALKQVVWQDSDDLQ